MYKRVLLCIALAVLLCLGLCACDSQLPQDQLDILQGTWFNEVAIIGRDGMPIDGIPFLIELSADGTCAFNGESSMTWKAKHNKETDNLELKIRKNKISIYTFTIESVDDNGTTIYQACLTDRKGKELFGRFTRPGSAEPYADWIDKVTAEWYPNEQSVLIKSLTIHTDGTCTFDGSSFRWAISPYNSNVDNTHFTAFIYDNQRTIFRFRAYFNTTSKTARLELDDTGGRTLVDYDFHPLKSTFIPAAWIAINQNDAVTPEVLTGNENVHFGISENNKDLPWELSDSTTDEKIVISVPDAAAPEYVIYMYMSGSYPRMSLVDKATGETYFYYQYGKGAPANP